MSAGTSAGACRRPSARPARAPRAACRQPTRTGTSSACRARSRRPPDVDVDATDAEHLDGSDSLRDSENPENSLSRDELELAINSAISRLPDDLRSAVTLREFDGLSYEQIAEIMDCPVGTVRSRIFRAREAIDDGSADHSDRLPDVGHERHDHC